MKKIRILNVVGARPNFMKIAPLINEFKRDECFETFLVHTGQHYDENMSDVFLRELGLVAPDLYLGVGSDTHARQTAKIMTGIEDILLKERPDLVVVVGDVNSTLAASLAAAKLRVPVAHIEAGLRSFDRDMPEEINRIVTDVLSDYLFTTCIDANENLLREGCPIEKVFFVGNVMIDTMKKLLPSAMDRGTFRRYGVAAKKYVLLTLHRPSNVDDKTAFSRILDAVKFISNEMMLPVLFPAHPRAIKELDKLGLLENYFNNSNKNLKLTSPLGYLEFLNLMVNSLFVMTDSGGIQEETTVLGIPCLTLRENTERPVTVRDGTNTLVGSDTQRILKTVKEIISGRYKKGETPELWDGHAAERIVAILKRSLCG